MDKPFKTIDEQIKILESRGMKVDESARDILLREGYYSVINGYKDLFIDKEQTGKAGEDRYKVGTTFDEVYRLFEFDRNLRLIMFRYFSIAEATLKTACAYNFSELHTGEKEAYLNTANYRNDAKYRKEIDRLISDFETALDRNPKKHPRKKAYLDHYKKNHDEVPLWVLLRYMTLGQTFKFFDFQKESMRNAIAKSFSALYAQNHDKPVRIYDRNIRLVFDHIKDFRNICAHDERLYCAKVSPSRSVSVSDVISDLGLVLPKSENTRMIREVVSLLFETSDNLRTTNITSLMSSMGIVSIDEAFHIRE